MKKRLFNEDFLLDLFSRSEILRGMNRSARSDQQIFLCYTYHYMKTSHKRNPGRCPAHVDDGLVFMKFIVHERRQTWLETVYDVVYVCHLSLERLKEILT